MKRVFIIYFIFNFIGVLQSTGQTLTVNDTLIAQDSIHSVDYDQQTVWSARRVLMEKLFADTTLIGSDSLFINFYNTYKNDNIGLLTKVRLALDTLNSIDSISSFEIQNNLNLIDAAMHNIALYDSTLINDSTLDSLQVAEMLGLIDGYNSNINTYSAANDSIYNLIQSNIATCASSIKVLNSLLSSSLVYEQNEIDVNSIYLSTIAMGQVDSLANYSSQLYAIARQCPLRGGGAVIAARSLYYLLNDTLLFNDEQICASPNDTCLVPPAPGIISGSYHGVCNNQFVYEIDSLEDVTGYTWTVDGFAAIDSGQGTAKIWVSFSDSFSVGTINVYGVNSCGSGNAASIAVTGYPVINTVSFPSAVCSFTSNVSFSVNSAEGATAYTWVVPAGCTITSGQGTNHIYVDWDSLPGNVIVVASNSCGETDSLIGFVDLAACRTAQSDTVIKNGNSDWNIRIYPNPTSGKITVAYHLESKGQLQLFDVLGKVIKTYNLNTLDDRFEFDISDLCCGIFEYRVIVGQNLMGRGKLVLVRGM